MQVRLIVSVLMVVVSAVAASGQQPPPVPLEPPTREAQSPSKDARTTPDPTEPSPEIERTLMQIRQLDELREENKRLLALLEALQSRSSEQLANVALRGIVVGRDGTAAALLQVETRTYLVRVGSELMLGSPDRADGARRVIVREIVGDSVQLQLGNSSETISIR